MYRLLLPLLLLSLSAAARTPEGTLDGLLLPNSGRPAVLAPGETFALRATEVGTLHLVGSDTRHALGETATDDRIALPEDIAPGRYALELTAGATTYTSPAAVYVRAEAIGTYYVIAHLGAAVAPDPTLTATVNASEATAVFISGIRTADYAAWLPWIAASTVPVIVAPPADPAARIRYQRYFGPVPFRVELGEDDYLAFALSASDLTPAGNQLYPLRRAGRASRWSVGLVDFYAPFTDFRAQWTVLRDDPLDYLLATRPDKAADDLPDIAQVPWGDLKLILTPAAETGVLRIIDVTAAGMKFRPLAPASTVPTP